MMNKSILAFCIILSWVFYSNPMTAQDSRTAAQPVTLQVAGSALLGIAGPKVSMQLAGAAEAGDAIQEAAQNNESRLRITSLVNDKETRAISAKISDPLVGTELFVELQQPNSNFTYPENMGTLMGSRLLTNESEVVLVQGIGTCWSGKTEGDGYVIKYTFRAIPKAPVLKSAVITVTYTISLVASDENV